MHFYSTPKLTKFSAAFGHWSQQDLCNWRVGRLGHCADRSSSSRRRRRGWPSWSRSRRKPGKDTPLQRSLPYLSHFLFNVRTLLRPVPVWEKATTVESDWVISFNIFFFLSHSCRNTFFGWGDFLSKLVERAKTCYHWITCFLPLALLDRTSNVKKLSRILLLKCVKQNPTTPKTLICNFSFLKCFRFSPSQKVCPKKVAKETKNKIGFILNSFGRFSAKNWNFSSKTCFYWNRRMKNKMLRQTRF